MSLIADALKAAQHEKSKRVPATAASSGGFFSLRTAPRKREGMPQSLIVALVAVGAFGVIAAFVTMLFASSKPATDVAAVPPEIAQPTISPPPAASNVQPSVAVDSASSIQSREPQQVTFAPATPSVSRAIDSTHVSPSLTPSSSLGNLATADSLQLDAVAATPLLAPPPKTAGTLKITMEDRPAPDIHTLFDQALAAQRRGDVVRAKELYTRALERDPRNAELFNNLGTLYRTSGDLDRAEDFYRRAIAIDQKMVAAWNNLGVLLDSRGRRKEAIAALQQAMAIDPSNASTKVNLALQYHAAGLYADARRLLEDAVKENPAMPEAHYALARTLEAQGDRSAALEHYSLFLRLSAGRFPDLERQVTAHLATLKGGE